MLLVVTVFGNTDGIEVEVVLASEELPESSSEPSIENHVNAQLSPPPTIP